MHLRSSITDVSQYKGRLKFIPKTLEMMNKFKAVTTTFIQPKKTAYISN
jgi:hypothetical protein